MSRRITTSPSCSHRRSNELEALRILGDALKFAPKNVQTLLLTARIQLRRNNLQAAEQATRLAFKEKPEHPEALTLLGQVLHETDRYDEAIDVLDRALKKAPDSPEALNFYGVALKSVGRLDEAREYILKALKLNDAMYGAYANLNDLVDFSEGVGEQLFNRMEAIFESVAKNPRPIPSSRFTSLMRRRWTTAASTRRRSSITSSAGEMKRAQLDYKESETYGFFDSIKAAFPKEAFENRKFEGLDDDRPVFIVGHAALGLDAGRADPVEPSGRLWRRRGEVSRARPRAAYATASRRCRNIPI